MKKVLFILLISLIYYTPSTASNCTSEDIEYAKTWDNYYKPQEAYDFGVKIQNIIKAKDLKGLNVEVKPSVKDKSKSSKGIFSLFYFFC